MERILIIGNGFDLDLGLKTSYKDFLDSNIFSQLKNESSLATYLSDKNQIGNWVDVEHELKNYAESIIEQSIEFNKDVSQIKPDFIKLKEALQEYLTVEIAGLNKARPKSNAFRLLKFGTLFDELNNFHDFNFFDSIEKKPFNAIYTLNFTNPFEKLNYSRHEGAADVFFMHGSLKQNNIVFGVEDGSVHERFNFLLKSDHAAFGKTPDLLLSIANETREFHFFGCSLGDTDNAHFSNFFSVLAKTSNPTDKAILQHKLFFYVYGKEGYEQIRNRLLRLTNGQLARFKLNHDVTFYDIKDNKIVDQTFLNQL